MVKGIVQTGFLSALSIKGGVLRRSPATKNRIQKVSLTG